MKDIQGLLLHGLSGSSLHCKPFLLSCKETAPIFVANPFFSVLFFFVEVIAGTVLFYLRPLAQCIPFLCRRPSCPLPDTEISHCLWRRPLQPSNSSYFLWCILKRNYAKGFSVTDDWELVHLEQSRTLASSKIATSDFLSIAPAIDKKISNQC